jgi:hypothetical protein
MSARNSFHPRRINWHPLRSVFRSATFRMRVHFIAIGGAVMHNLAIALHLKGYTVTGSDDEILNRPAHG